MRAGSELPFILTNAAAVAVLVSGVALLIGASVRGRPFGLGPQRLRLAAWPGAACLAAFLALWGHEIFGLAAAMAGSSRAARLAVDVATLPIQLGLLYAAAVALGYVARRPSLSWEKLRSDLATAFAVFLVITPLSLAIQHAVRAWTSPDGQPTTGEHVLITQLRQDPDLSLWILIALEAIVAAPLREELFFRGIVQPWAVRRAGGGDVAAALAAFSGLVMLQARPNWWAVAATATGYAILAWVVLLVVRWLWRSERYRPIGVVARCFPRMAQGSLPAEQVYRGVAGTSLLFAMTHMASWPDPVALTVLSLGLGWLAWRTQSLIAPVVCHALFNAATVYQLRIITLLNGAATG
jgi:membrane protease YdiL (CAAX protease family)